MPEPSAKRTYRLVLLLLTVSGVLVIVGFALPWASVTLPLASGVEHATKAAEFTGQSMFPGAAAVGWACLAGVAGILATRSWGRVIVGVVVFVAGVVAAYASARFAVDSSSAVDSAASAIVGSPVTASGSITAWWAVAMMGGICAALAGAWTVLRGREWPAMGSRYERTPRRAAPVSPWDALDKGEDPTDDLVE